MIKSSFCVVSECSSDDCPLDSFISITSFYSHENWEQKCLEPRIFAVQSCECLEHQWITLSLSAFNRVTNVLLWKCPIGLFVSSFLSPEARFNTNFVSVSVKQITITAVLSGVALLFVTLGLAFCCHRFCYRRRKRIRTYGRIRASELTRPEEVPMISSNSVGSDLDEWWSGAGRVFACSP